MRSEGAGQAEVYRLETERLRCDLALDGELRLEALHDRARDRPLTPAPAPLLTLTLDGARAEISLIAHDAQALRLQLAWPDQAGVAELEIQLDGSVLSWRLSWERVAGPLRLRLPLLLARGADGHPQGLGSPCYHDEAGRPLVRHADWPLPLVWDSGDDLSLTLLSRTTPSRRAFDQLELLSTEGLALDPAASSAITGELWLHEGGWPAAFERFRQHIRGEFNLEQYRRPDLAWYGDQLVQHFTFLYGREILNLEAGTFELDRLLDDGERDFGGYDGMLIWAAYPRLGVDERTQWEFYDDLPGGREGLRAMARSARARGTRFFIPYKPWDRSAELHGATVPPDSEELARLASDVEADGVFLDTMSAIDVEFRAALDRARPGVVFCSEGRAFDAAFETITGGWDQSLYRDILHGNWSPLPEHMPAVDLWRFLFPEHRLFVINRHAMGDDRIRIIQRGFFNAMGWVVWQDVFGLALPFAPAEAALLKRCRSILREHRSAINSLRPTPLIATGTPGIYANAFPAAEKQLWTLYNATDSPVQYRLPFAPRPGYHLVDLWGETALASHADGGPSLALAPRSVAAVAELPQLLRYAPERRLIELADEVGDRIIEVRSPAGHWARPAAGTALALPQLGGPCVVRLLRDGELLDQLVLTNGAER